MKGKVYYRVVYAARVLIWPKTIDRNKCLIMAGGVPQLNKVQSSICIALFTGMKIVIYGVPDLITNEFSTGFFTQDGKINLNRGF